MAPATEQQVRRIALSLPFTANITERFNRLQAFRTLDRSTASSIIGMLEKGQKDFAKAQIAHILPELVND